MLYMPSAQGNDRILRRFAPVNGKEAPLAATGEGFEAVMESRGTGVIVS